MTLTATAGKRAAICNQTLQLNTEILSQLNIDHIFYAIIKPLEGIVIPSLSSWRAPTAREAMCSSDYPQDSTLTGSDRWLLTYPLLVGVRSPWTQWGEEPLFCKVLIWVMDTGTGGYGNSFHLIHSVASRMSWLFGCSHCIIAFRTNCLIFIQTSDPDGLSSISLIVTSHFPGQKKWSHVLGSSLGHGQEQQFWSPVQNSQGKSTLPAPRTGSTVWSWAGISPCHGQTKGSEWETSSMHTRQLQTGHRQGSSRMVLRQSLLTCRNTRCRTVRQNQTLNKLGREKKGAWLKSSFSAWALGSTSWSTLLPNCWSCTSLSQALALAQWWSYLQLPHWGLLSGGLFTKPGNNTSHVT